MKIGLVSPFPPNVQNDKLFSRLNESLMHCIVIPIYRHTHKKPYFYEETIALLLFTISLFRHLGNITFVNPERVVVMGEGYGGYLAVRTLEEDARLGAGLVQCGAGVGGVAQWQRHTSLFTRQG